MIRSILFIVVILTMFTVTFNSAVNAYETAVNQLETINQVKGY